MGRRPKEEVKKVVSNLKEEPKEIVSAIPEKSFVEKMQEEQTQLNALNTEKAGKDILIKNIRQLEEHIRNSRAELDRVNNELEGKYRALRSVDDDIKSQLFILERQKEKFEKQHKSEIDELVKKANDIEASDKEYKALISETMQLKNNLRNDLQKIADERSLHAKEMGVVTRNSEQIQGEMNRQNADMAEREEKLKDEIKAFEEEKELLRPELTRISEIKNENILLWQKIEQDKAQFEHSKSSFENFQKKQASDIELERARIKNLEQAILAKEGKLRKWEEDLNDIQLELKAREAEAQKMMKRYQLHKVAEQE